MSTSVQVQVSPAKTEKELTFEMTATLDADPPKLIPITVGVAMMVYSSLQMGIWILVEAQALKQGRLTI